VVELALFKSCPDTARELLSTVGELVAITLDAARAQQLERDLLHRTQELADRLAIREEELRANNSELSTQRAELQLANTALEKQREALSGQNAALEETRGRLQEQAQELEKVSSYKSRFLANMSHELRTPLNSMLLLSHLLSENESKNLNLDQVEYARTIHSAGKDLLSLINQVLDLAKIEAGHQRVDLEVVSLSELAEFMSSRFRSLAQDRGLTLEVELAPDLPAAIVTDGQRLERIAINLLGNAIKFTEKGGVSVRIGRPAEGTPFVRPGLTRASSVALSVTDTGIGIAAEDLERVFAPFEQVDSRSDRRYGGSGLGLAIARESAALLGGELVVQSQRGQGSTFTLFLPEAPPNGHSLSPPSLERKRVSPREVTDDRTSLHAKEPYLLIIEDDPVFAQILMDISHAQHFKVLVAGGGEDGLTLAREHKPRAIILDVRLPDISGWTVMERLRRDDRTRSIPAYFISSIDAPERGLALGAVGYLTKPPSPAELTAVVQGLIRSSEALEQKVLVVEDDQVEGATLIPLMARAGFKAQLARRGAEALELLATERFGCVILDLGLPDMDGLSLLETLAARPELEFPRVVIHTARDLTTPEKERLEAYAQAVVLKDGHSRDRLLDEVRLFFQKLDDNPKDAEATPARPADVVTTASDSSATNLGAAHAQPEAALQTAPREGSLRGRQILLVDDDMRTVYAVSALLRGRGADVLVGSTGREALDLLHEHPEVHAVLMDIMMPEMDGYEAMRQLRSEACFASLPVIALTAKAMKGERENCIQAGASDYLSKPVDPTALLSMLGAWLPERTAEHPS
jgi:CheY-like chemotaxis protein/signal transduction histidine kinase